MPLPLIPHSAAVTPAVIPKQNVDSLLASLRNRAGMETAALTLTPGDGEQTGGLHFRPHLTKTHTPHLCGSVWWLDDAGVAESFRAFPRFHLSVLLCSPPVLYKCCSCRRNQSVRLQSLRLPRLHRSFNSRSHTFQLGPPSAAAA